MPSSSQKAPQPEPEQDRPKSAPTPKREKVDTRPKWEIDLEKDLDSWIKKSLEERKKHFKELMLKYHPDKNQEADKELANAQMRYLLSKKNWFLEP